MVYYNPLYTPNNQGSFFPCSLNLHLQKKVTNAEFAWHTISSQIFLQKLGRDAMCFCFPPKSTIHREEWWENPWDGTLNNQPYIPYLGSGFKYFYFHPYLGKWWKLTNIFFKWVGSTTNYFYNVFFLGMYPLLKGLLIGVLNQLGLGYQKTTQLPDRPKTPQVHGW